MIYLKSKKWICFLIQLFVLSSFGKGDSIKHAIRHGSENAPITLIEFVSPTCHVCAEFCETLLPQLEKQYIQKGKVKLIIVTLPFNYVDLKVSQIIMGSKNPLETYKKVFKAQNKWLLKKDPLSSLKTVLKKGGTASKTLERVLKDEALENKLIKQRLQLEPLYEIDAIPLCILGRRKIVGLIPWKELKKHIDESLNFVTQGGDLDKFGKTDEEISAVKRKKKAARRGVA